MNMQNLFLAKKYARAFVALNKSILTWQDLEGIKKLIIFLIKHKEALFYAQLSELDGKIVQSSFSKILEQFKINYVLLKLIDLLIVHRRLFLLIDILEYVVVLMKSHLNIMEFTIISSHAIGKEQINKIIEFLPNSTKKQIIYKTKIDKRLIAGFQLYSDTFGWEFSVRKQLEALSRIS